MLVVIPTHTKDREQAVRLANWIAELGTVEKHQVLLVLGAGTPAAGIAEPLKAAFRHFAMMPLRDPDPPPSNIEGSIAHAPGANLMFRRAAKEIQAQGDALRQQAIAHNQKNPRNRKPIPTPEPWLWLEPDAIPLCPGWLDKIEAEYKEAKRPFMGARVLLVGAPEHMSGVAVYPWNAASIDTLVCCELAPFDVNSAKDVLPRMHETKLIQHEWHPSQKWEDANELHVRLRPEAVIYHQAKKNGQLIDLLRIRPKDPRKSAQAEPSNTFPHNAGETVFGKDRTALEDGTNATGRIVFRKDDATAAEMDKDLALRLAGEPVVFTPAVQDMIERMTGHLAAIAQSGPEEKNCVEDTLRAHGFLPPKTKPRKKTKKKLTKPPLSRDAGTVRKDGQASATNK